MQKCEPFKMQNISISRALSKKLCKTLHLSNLVETCVIDQMAEGNFVVEGQTDVGNWSWKFLVVLSAFFLRMTIDGTHYASGIFEGEIKKELGLQTY